MVFSSFPFLLVFLPLVLAGYYALSRVKNDIYQRLFIILTSLFFYGYQNPKYLVLILSSIAVNYLIAIAIQKTEGKQAKLFLTLGVLFNVALIGYYKYYDFFIENINLVAGTDFVLKRIMLPLGISFFTFQQLSFLVSVYQGEEKVGKLRDYALFVLFFPQLVAGPIVLYSEMIPQFKDRERRYFNSENFAAGLYIFAMGLFKKAVLADTLCVFADNGFAMTNHGLAAAWATTLSYTLQIYFDFSGYSDMAVGLGKMFNIDIPFNFRSPYQSESITQFWRKWHITLGRALSTYVYKPLGGNRKGIVRTCINLLLTFLVSGFWHGASWTFIIWGGLHGVFMVAERLLGKRREAVPKAIRIFATFMVVNALWVLFRGENMGQTMEIYRGMVAFDNIALTQLDLIMGETANINFPVMFDIAYISTMIVALLFVVFGCKNSASRLECYVANNKTAITAAGLFAVAILCMSRESVFIYFNF